MKFGSMTNIRMVTQRHPSSSGRGYAQESPLYFKFDMPFDIWCLFRRFVEAESTEVAQFCSSSVEGRSIQLQCLVFGLNWLTTFSSSAYAVAHDVQLVLR